MQDTEEAKIGPRRQKAPRMRSRKKKKKKLLDYLLCQNTRIYISVGEFGNE